MLSAFSQMSGCMNSPINCTLGGEGAEERTNDSTERTLRVKSTTSAGSAGVPEELIREDATPPRVYSSRA